MTTGKRDVSPISRGSAVFGRLDRKTGELPTERKGSAVENYSKPFAETYTMRSRFFHDLGESAKKLADTYTYDTDAENRQAFKELVWDAVCHSLVEHHGFKADEL